MVKLIESEVLKKMTIFIDTREKYLNHILPYLSGKKISFAYKKLDFGDYSFKYENISFEKEFAIERKGSLTELSGNFTSSRERFEREFKRAKESKAKIILMIENGSYTGIFKRSYGTGLKEKAFYASLMSFRYKYDIQVDFVRDCESGLHILYNCYYFFRNKLKEGGNI